MPDRGTYRMERPLRNQESLDALVRWWKTSYRGNYFCLVSTVALRILGIHEKSEYYDKEIERKKALSRQDHYLELRRS